LVPFNRIGNFVPPETGVAPPLVVAICHYLSDMELIAKERDRLLQRTARFLGLSGTILTLISLSFPGVVPFTQLVATVPLLLILALCLFMVARNHPTLWAVIGIVAGVGALAVARLPYNLPPSDGLASALAPLGAAGIACFSLVLVSNVPRILLVIVGAAASHPPDSGVDDAARRHPRLGIVNGARFLAERECAAGRTPHLQHR
jgi:hypothetical protein